MAASATSLRPPAMEDSTTTISSSQAAGGGGQGGRGGRSGQGSGWRKANRTGGSNNPHLPPFRAQGRGQGGFKGSHEGSPEAGCSPVGNPSRRATAGRCALSRRPMPPSAITTVSSHCFCSLLREWCTSRRTCGRAGHAGQGQHLPWPQPGMCEAGCAWQARPRRSPGHRCLASPLRCPSPFRLLLLIPGRCCPSMQAELYATCSGLSRRTCLPRVLPSSCASVCGNSRAGSRAGSAWPQSAVKPHLLLHPGRRQTTTYEPLHRASPLPPPPCRPCPWRHSRLARRPARPAHLLPVRIGRHAVGVAQQREHHLPQAPLPQLQAHARALRACMRAPGGGGGRAGAGGHSRLGGGANVSAAGKGSTLWKEPAEHPA